MSLLSPRNQLIACLLLAGVGLAMFFGGGYRDLPLLADLPMAWIGSVIFVAAVWFCVDAVHRIPSSDDETRIAPGEWQAWIGVAFVGAVIASSLLNAGACPSASLRHTNRPAASASTFVANGRRPLKAGIKG